MAHYSIKRSRNRLAMISQPAYSNPLGSMSGLRNLNKLAVRRRARAGKTRFSQYVQDYGAYVREVLGGKPWTKQEAIFESIRDNPRTLVMAAFGTGKTWAVAAAANAYFDSHPNSRVILTAPKMQQVR